MFLFQFVVVVELSGINDGNIGSAIFGKRLLRTGH